MQTNNETTSMNVIETLRDRGFIENTTHEKELEELFTSGEQVTCYIGFDPTASSLHIGSLIPIMSLAHMQKGGHRPIALVGGGTGLVGDPSGKTEMRKLLTSEDVDHNVGAIKKQLSNFIDFNEEKALVLNNADWLTKLEYIPFLRDIGKHFSVNRMIKAESYKIRLDSEDGLNFIEFNYMLLQAYDFLELYKNHGCRLQMGGSDQWGNIVAGVDLVRREQQKTVFGATFPLITTSSGEKMGKTAKGAVWLDPQRTSPYEYYQFWINTEDADVEKFLALFTFLPMNEIKKIGEFQGSELNVSKTVLAFEATSIAHGIEEAQKSYSDSVKMFGQREISPDILPSGKIHTYLKGRTTEDSAQAVPATEMDEADLINGIPAFKIFNTVGLAKSGSAARKLIQQGGAYINGERVGSDDRMVSQEDLDDGEILLRAGKKRYHKIVLKKS